MFSKSVFHQMNEFLEIYDLPNLNQDEINNLDRSTCPSEIEAEIKNLPTKISPRANGFSPVFYQTFKEE